MRVRDLKKKSSNRIDTSYLQNLGIQAYGQDNLYPQTLKVSIRPRACFSPSYNKVKSQTKHVWLLTLL